MKLSEEWVGEQQAMSEKCGGDWARGDAWKTERLKIPFF